MNEIQNATDYKYEKLFLGILFDFIGMLSYIFPFVGESFDIVWAPISGILLSKMYKGNLGKVAGFFAFLEEIIPFTDIIPTFTITWIYTFVYKKATS